ncbi:hypothetical protein D0469_07520 [Peribacillus saganii]|uniref:Staygreen protein domain-containing protein n=1 Tax=Peribacillus saganii TaxID=2303992 RepID=A0A372LR76_9BACI|nr:staygreen family protein [Peribacillus saganii]RFU70427.1 hypothetical protein D0469_07520 [Peribacillus saganii]
MSKLNPEKLSVIYFPPVTECMPVDGRKYTVTHSDLTGDLFLSVGCQYDYSRINASLRDEILAEWLPKMGQYILSGRVYVNGGEFDENITKVRYMIFRKEMDLALQAITQGDSLFFCHFPWLLDSPIYIHFESRLPEYDEIVHFGTPRNYLLTNIHGYKP